MTNTYFTKEEVMEMANELIEGGFQGDAFELTMEVANTDYYIIGTAKAEAALAEYGTFAAIRKVREYEEVNFGEVNTDISDPEKLANMLFYIIATEVIAENFQQLNAA